MSLINGDAQIPGAPHFLWREFSGWDKATAVELERLRLLASTVLEPVRVAFGPVVISAGGWLYSRWGWRRSGGHGTGAFADFNVRGRSTYDVWVWIGQHLPGRYGEVIDERDHVHASLPGFGGAGEFLSEPKEGTYVAYDPSKPPPRPGTAELGPVELPGLTVTVAGGPSGWWWVLGLALAGLAMNDRKKRGA